MQLSKETCAENSTISAWRLEFCHVSGCYFFLRSRLEDVNWYRSKAPVRGMSHKFENCSNA